MGCSFPVTTWSKWGTATFQLITTGTLDNVRSVYLTVQITIIAPRSSQEHLVGASSHPETATCVLHFPDPLQKSPFLHLPLIDSGTRNNPPGQNWRENLDSAIGATKVVFQALFRDSGSLGSVTRKEGVLDRVTGKSKVRNPVAPISISYQSSYSWIYCLFEMRHYRYPKSGKVM